MKRLFPLAVLGVLILLLTGCATVQLNIRVLPDGTGEQETIIAFDRQAYSLLMSGGQGDPLQEAEKEMRDSGATVSRYEADGRVGIRGVRSFENASDMTFGKDPWVGRLDVQPSMFWKDYAFAMDADLSMDAQEQQDAAPFLGQIDFGVSVSLPTEIKEHNGQADSTNKRVSWSLIPGRKEHLTLYARQYLWGRIWTAIGLLAVMAVGAVLTYVRHRRAITAPTDPVQGDARGGQQ